MKILKPSRGFLIIYFIIFIILLKFLKNYNNVTFNFVENLKPIRWELNSCPVPNYEIYSTTDDTLLSNLKCSKKSDLVIIKNGSIVIVNQNSCTYQCIFWNTDFDYKLSEVKTLRNFQPVPCQYFAVSCENDKKVSNIQLVITAVRDEKLVNNLRTYSNGTTKRDVLILGIDSLSYLAFKHYLPKTYKVIHRQLNGVSFRKFNTMGDGTTVNLQGLLTGTKDTETYEARRRISGAKYVDNFDWIWKHYKKHGYLTQYYEEMTDFGTFQYRLLGFEHQPTDIYLRTAMMYAERTKYSQNLCLGNKPQHLEILRFYKEVLKVYEELPTFSFIYHSVASHDNNKYVSYLDEDLARFLVDMRSANPSMMIIVYADHGHRFMSRLSMQGKYEERLPFLGISLPRDMESLVPVLKRNSEILTSSLDVHATLEDILGTYRPHVRSRHMSLLRPLPEDRSCNDIESAAHWCVCVSWREIANPNQDKILVAISKAVVAQISGYTASHRVFCAELRLDSILTLYKMNANEQVLKFKQSADVDGFVPDLSDHMEESDVWFRVTLRTKPADAIFEVTVSVKQRNLSDIESIKIGQILPNDVSRINKYAPWIKCLLNVKVASVISDVRKFCICRDSL